MFLSNISRFELKNQFDNETVLLSISTELKKIIEDFIHEW